MAQYSSFYEAYKAKNPNYNPWTPQQLQGLASDYSSKNPTWTPSAADNARLPTPIVPVKFDPYLDPSYAAAASLGGTRAQQAQGQLAYQAGRTAQQYGYDAQGKEITSGADLNPYAVAAVLKRNWQNSRRGTLNSYASQGQLYAGSLKNAQATNDWNYGLGADQAKRGAADAYNNANLGYQGVLDANAAQLASLLSPAFANFLASQRGY